MLSIENSANEIIIFLGAGVSIPAGVSGAKGMVTKLIQKLERTKYAWSYQRYCRSSFELEE